MLTTATITRAADDGGEATHAQMLCRSNYRRGSTGFAELAAWGGWIVTGWSNQQLDTDPQFIRLDGKPQVSLRELEYGKVKQDDELEDDFEDATDEKYLLHSELETGLDASAGASSWWFEATWGAAQAPETKKENDEH